MELSSIAYFGQYPSSIAYFGQYPSNPDTMSASLSVRPAHPGSYRVPTRPTWSRRSRAFSTPSRRTLARTIVAMAESRADDSAPFEMSVESALKLLGVSESASFDDILRAKNSILASRKDDPETTAQVEAAYDMLLMQRLTQRQAGKVMNNSIRYADVKPVNNPSLGTMPQWIQSTIKGSSVIIEKQPSSDLGIQASVYGALMILTYMNGMSSSSTGLVAGPDVPGFILATSFGASLYFMTKKNVKLGKATMITVGGLVAGAIVGSAVENWLQVDIVPFLGLHSPAAVVSEFILLSQFLVSLYLR